MYSESEINAVFGVTTAAVACLFGLVTNSSKPSALRKTPPVKSKIFVCIGTPLFLSVALITASGRVSLSLDNTPALPAASPLAASAFPRFRGDLHNTGRASGRPVKAVEEWRFLTRRAPCGSPVYDGEGTLLFASDALHAVDAATGEQKWEFAVGLDGFGSAAPIIGANGLIYIASVEGLHAIDRRAGKVVWKYPTRSAGNATGAVGKDGTVYAYLGGAFVALNGKTGVEKWEFAVPNPHPDAQHIPSSPTLDNHGAVIFGGANQSVYALDCDTGKPRWTRDIGQSLINSSPAIGDDGTVYISSSGPGDSRINALDGATGAIVWRMGFRVGVIGSPALGDNGLLYFGCGNRSVYALDQRGGDVRWKYTTGSWIESSPAIGMDGTVYIGSGDHKLYALDGATGAKKWEYATEAGIFSSPLITPDGSLFFSSNGGAFHALPKPLQDQLAKEQSAPPSNEQEPPG